MREHVGTDTRRERNRGITLIEVLVVIVIIMSLTGLLFPTFAQAKRRAKDVVCTSNLRSCFMAAALYAADYDDMWPMGKDCTDLKFPGAWPGAVRRQVIDMPLLSVQLEPYGATKNVWQCPLDSGIQVVDTQPAREYVASPSLFAECGMSYFYNTAAGLGGLPFTAVPNPSEMMYLRDEAGHWHPGVEALPSGAFPSNTELWTKLFSYNTVFVDGHVKKIGYEESKNAFGGGL